jgi:phosphohistidine phosphatase
MDLILWRHAEAEDSLNDLSRKLTEKGHRQAKSSAEFLRKNLPVNIEILVSPAIRTQQTAKAFSSNFKTMDSLSPGASVSDLLQAAHWPDANGTVLIVGHQPTLGAVAALLLGCEHESLRIKKSSLWWFTKKEGSNEISLKLVISPDLLANSL